MKKMMKRIVFPLMLVSMTVAQLDAAIPIYREGLWQWNWLCVNRGYAKTMPLSREQDARLVKRDNFGLLAGLVSLGGVLAVTKGLALLKGEGMFENESTLDIATVAMCIPFVGCCVYGSKQQDEVQKDKWHFAALCMGAFALLPIGIRKKITEDHKIMEERNKQLMGLMEIMRMEAQRNFSRISIEQ